MAEKKGKGGRPIASKSPRDRGLKIRLTEDERQRIESDAREAGVTLAELVRTRVLSARVLKSKASVPAVNKEAYAELARSAANLNQVAHHLNEGRKKMDDLLAKTLESLLSKMLLDLKNVRLSLIKNNEKEDDQ